MVDEQQQMGARRAPRLEDVARIVGVSKSTAARALRDSPLVTEETKARVRQAAADLNYRVNALARAMSAGSTQTLGLVIADISNTFFDQATRAIIDTAARQGYQVLVLNTGESLSVERDAIRVLWEKRVDGIILVPSSPDEFAHLQGGSGSVPPLVLLDRSVPELGAPTVTTNDFQSSYEAVSLLLDRGHREIDIIVNTSDRRTVVAGNPGSAISTIFNRVSGGWAALSDRGIDPQARRPLYVPPAHDEATSAIQHLLESAERPTAVMTTNSDAALAVMDAASKVGLKVGSDLSLISFDDTPWAPVFSPALSVIRRPIADLGRTAVELLLETMHGETLTPGTIELVSTVVDRGSVSSISAAATARHS
ncbi:MULTISPECIES: LacI family DNA-binding transcriptional regulator [unclassified Microbacterium]|uniref:LacI family DNA-binding transcriptional regulator n=1 Tax=unclassified Microbacterium TaxID=2609290 RepID=UPI003661AEB2